MFWKPLYWGEICWKKVFPRQWRAHLFRISIPTYEGKYCLLILLIVIKLYVNFLFNEKKLVEVRVIVSNRTELS